MRNLLFFDIDGTLITEDERHLFPADAKAALEAARHAGNLIFINTGRTRFNVEQILAEAEFDGVVCGCGTYIEYHGEVLHHHMLSRERCYELAQICRECRMQAIFEYSDFCGYDAELDLPFLAPMIQEMKDFGFTVQTDITAPDFRFDKFAGWFDETGDVERFRREIEKDFVYIHRGEGFFEVEPIGYSKASGMQFLLDYFQLPTDAAYAFGDSNNDLEMLQFAAHAVSMARGSEACRKAAHFVTTDVEEGGIRIALEHFGLLG